MALDLIAPFEGDDGDQSFPLGDLAESLARAGEFREAVATASAASAPTTRVDALAAVAVVQSVSGDPDGAKTTFEKAVLAAEEVPGSALWSWGTTFDPDDDQANGLRDRLVRPAAGYGALLKVAVARAKAGDPGGAEGGGGGRQGEQGQEQGGLARRVRDVPRDRAGPGQGGRLCRGDGDDRGVRASAVVPGRRADQAAGRRRQDAGRRGKGPGPCSTGPRNSPPPRRGRRSSRRWPKGSLPGKKGPWPFHLRSTESALLALCPGQGPDVTFPPTRARFPLLVLGLLTAPPDPIVVAPQPPVAGLVVDEEGRPVADAEVFLVAPQVIIERFGAPGRGGPTRGPVRGGERPRGHLQPRLDRRARLPRGMPTGGRPRQPPEPDEARRARAAGAPAGPGRVRPRCWVRWSPVFSRARTSRLNAGRGEARGEVGAKEQVVDVDADVAGKRARK